MKYIVFLLLLLGFGWMCSCENNEETTQKISNEEIKTQKITFIKTIPITGVVDLAFAKIDTVHNLYQEPYIKVGKKAYSIKGYHSINGSRDKNIALSPDGRYFIMDSISEGDEAQQKTCVVVDLLHKRVVHHLQNDCDGEWNAQGQWVKGGQIILSLD